MQDFKTAIGETRKLYSGARRGDAAARCALNEIEHYFLCGKGQAMQSQWPDQARLLAYRTHLRDALGNGASRANSKLSVLRQVYKVGGAVPPFGWLPFPRSKAPKWVLTEADEARLMAWLSGRSGSPLYYTMSDFIPFVIETGVRVEEVLRIRIEMLHDKDGHYTLEVPGTKTARSFDMLPISDKAARIILRRQSEIGDRIFPTSYETTASLWDECRKFLGLMDNPTATLKGLRRTFAYRHRHLPPAVLQRLLRHTNLATTSEYLNVTGMNEDLRGWLDGSKTTLIGTQGKVLVVDEVETPSDGAIFIEAVKAYSPKLATVAESMKAAGFTPEEVARALAAL